MERGRGGAGRQDSKGPLARQPLPASTSGRAVRRADVALGQLAYGVLSVCVADSRFVRRVFSFGKGNLGPAAQAADGPLDDALRARPMTPGGKFCSYRISSSGSWLQESLAIADGGLQLGQVRRSLCFGGLNAKPRPTSVLLQSGHLRPSVRASSPITRWQPTGIEQGAHDLRQSKQT